MTPEQSVEVIKTLSRIEQTCVNIKETNDRHERAINANHRRTDEHDKKFARMKGGMSVLAILFTGFLALLGLNWE